MAYLNELLGDGEAVVFETHQHGFILFSRVLAELVLLVLLIAVAVFVPTAFGLATSTGQLVQLGAAALGVIVLLSAFGDYLRWSREQYIVTDRRVMQLRGVLNKSVLDSSLEKINDVEMRQTMLGRMFGYGDIEILTASEEGINRMAKIANPLRFKKAMLDARARYDHYMLPQQPVANAPLTPQAMLTQLAALHANGVLNDAEFEAKKREVLSRI